MLDHQLRDRPVHELLQSARPGISLVAVDIGAGTQDVLVFLGEESMENSVQLVLPSQTRVIARRIARATGARLPVFLDGHLMGGGACVGAVKRHLKEGLPVYAAPGPAKTVHDNLDRVSALGVQVGASPPENAVRIMMTDLDLPALRSALAPFDVDLPERVVVAVQDHGDSPHASNRALRFDIWRRFVESGGRIERLLYHEVPPHLTRMASVKAQIPEALIMDTSAAAIWGALCDHEVGRKANDGVTLLNVGNAHTVGVLLKGRRVLGLFEHHTRLMDAAKIRHCVERLQDSSLRNLDVFEDGGHGCFIHPDYRPGEFTGYVAVTGPNRGLVSGQGWHFAAPFGNMMLAGSFGLAAAFLDRLATGGPPLL